jgi:superfamily II DNA or RNA helicase
MTASFALREWQTGALQKWRESDCRGIVEVVTGGGKTVFALACVRDLKPNTVLIVVPTTALLEQWWAEVATFFDLDLDEVNIITGNRQMVSGTINIAVLNTAAKLAQRGVKQDCFLVVDECHKAASAQFRSVLGVPTIAALGLSATPERPYDDGLSEILIPALGPVIYSYSYREALRDGVIVPFEVRNVVFDLEEERAEEYDKLTKSITRMAGRFGFDSDEVVPLLLRRTRVVNLSLKRVEIAIRLVKAHRDQRVLVFHEDVEACNLIYTILSDAGFLAGVYHSRLKPRDRAGMLAKFRKGELDVLVTCRALDEGFNVPETEVGIIAASTATRRQRIQRLGRILRPASGKNGAVVYTLVATGPEVGRLKEEEEDISDIATVTWVRG